MKIDCPAFLLFEAVYTIVIKDPPFQSRIRMFNFTDSILTNAFIALVLYGVFVSLISVLIMKLAEKFWPKVMNDEIDKEEVEIESPKNQP